MNINISLIDFMKLFGTNVQYSVPKWQRRYSWDKSTIQQLAKDLVAIAKKKSADAMHFGGTLITYSESTPAGTSEIHNVVDGQQRLTTISILLICIAEKLKETNDKSGEWTSERITNVLLNNNLSPHEKLQLQDGDNDEYRQILSGTPRGEGKVTVAWGELRKIVDDVGPDLLLEGLRRFKVISFPCQSSDDPQQIFESLNATGVMLTEGEKTKNWLLMGLDKESQNKAYQEHWCRIEHCLDALSEPKRIDEFLRDLLRWKTGENIGIKHTYANLRRWWYEHGDDDRTILSDDLRRLSVLYGKITGTYNIPETDKINHLLHHLRCVGIHVHRPFTLRVLSDAMNPSETGAYEDEVIRVLEALSIWLTRIWLAHKPTPGLNTEFANLAHQSLRLDYESYADYWIKQIKKLRKTRSAVPNEDEVRQGLKKRKAYGGKASDASKSILWTLNSMLGNQASPIIEDLSLEHIMPQYLNKSWREYLGASADEINEDYGNTLANLTLVGTKFNSEISNQIYSKKRNLYYNSGVTLTRRFAQSYETWRKEDMDKRIDELTLLIIKCWPWENITRAKVRWRIGLNDWKNEKKYTDLLLGVISELLTISPQRNSSLLLGDSPNKNIFFKGREPQKPNLLYKPIPNHGQYVVNVHFSGKAIQSLCQKMAEMCGTQVELEIFNEYRNGQEIWEKIESKPPSTQKQARNNLRWRINGGHWSDEKTYRSTLLNVISALLNIDSYRNSNLLLGTRMGRDLFFAGKEPTSAGAHFKPIPGFSQFVVNLNHSASTIVKLCKEMGSRCDVRVEVENSQTFEISTAYRWRINKEEWKPEETSSRILLNLIKKLLDLDPLRNPLKLSGDSVTADLLPSHFSPEDPKHFHKIPSYENYMIYVDPNPANLIKQCKNLASRCSVVFEVESKKAQS